MKKFAFQITTKNRKNDLLFTLSQLESCMQRDDIECIVCDDGSDDGTFEAVNEQFPKVKLVRNEKSRGLIYSRNIMLNQSEADYVISLDDDANFLSDNVPETIENYFLENPKCGVIAFRIFWGKSSPDSLKTGETPERVIGFVGCGHAWNRKAWT